MDNRATLIEKIGQLSEHDVAVLLEIALPMAGGTSQETKPECPYCGSSRTIRYGRKHGKQRFWCKACERTFVTTTHTVMSMSHYAEDIWREAITDTLQGYAIDHTARRLGLYHQAAFDMRHKILVALQELPEIQDVCLGEVAELDETFVLDSYKGSKLPDHTDRAPRKRGTKAAKRGISNEYICICAGIQRAGHAYAATVNRAKPSLDEVKAMFQGHISDGTLVLCDGLQSYNALPEIADCTVKNCNAASADEKCFYNLNTVNGFHSYIKRQYSFYRGVASKYLNRYNALFSIAYRDVKSKIGQFSNALLSVTTHNNYHSIRTLRTAGVLAI